MKKYLPQCNGCTERKENTGHDYCIFCGWKLNWGLKEDCEHKDIKLVGAIANTHLCFKCGKQLTVSEIEIFNQFYDVGAFCNDEKCERFLLLVV